MFTLGVLSELLEAVVKAAGKKAATVPEEGVQVAGEEGLHWAIEHVAGGQWWQAALIIVGILVVLWIYVCATEKEARQAVGRGAPSPGIRPDAPPLAEHAFAGSAAKFAEICKVDRTGRVAAYRTRCGLYVAKGHLAAPGRTQSVRCLACQRAMEGKPKQWWS